MKKTILVTGGAGFIGSHLCNKLLSENNKVICVDNLFTGSKENIFDLLKNPDFNFIEHDIIDPLYIDEINEIYNLACPASPLHYQENPIKTIKTCTIGTINILGLAKKNNAKVLQASTSEVYGDPQKHPQNEGYYGNVNPVGYRSCYDEGKRCAETLFMDYHREHNLKIKIVRIFNTYGPHMAFNDGRVVSNFINQAINGQNITIYGKGKQTRSFMYIDDLINGIIKMMQSKDKIIGPINLGNPIEISVLELANKILDITGSGSKLVYKKLPNDDPQKRRPDIDFANNILEWAPSIDLDNGLKQTIDFFKKKQNFNF